MSDNVNTKPETNTGAAPTPVTTQDAIQIVNELYVAVRKIEFMVMALHELAATVEENPQAAGETPSRLLLAGAATLGNSLQHLVDGPMGCTVDHLCRRLGIPTTEEVDGQTRPIQVNQEWAATVLEPVKDEVQKVAEELAFSDAFEATPTVGQA